jgi:uncharacterized protein YegL
MASKKLLTTKILTFLVVLIFLGLSAGKLRIEPDPASAQTAPDAIAVRVLPNSYHYSPMRWYREQGFDGSPERLEVDGYNAVREGRTVYVNVGNVSNNNFYSNIYVLSFTQEATPETLEIFQRMINNWEFNTNVGRFGQCNISQYNCHNNEDCPSDYECNNNSKCIPSQPISCSTDSDCPPKVFCDSEKAKLTRDTERLEDMSEMRGIFLKYKQTHGGKHLRLDAGTYLANKTISAWPSWKQTLEEEMQPIIDEYSVLDELPRDPLNILGNCGQERFDPRTCWDDNAKEFAGSVTADGRLRLPGAPQTSFSYVYTTTPDNELDICVPLELAGLNVGNIDPGQCADSSRSYSLAEYNPLPVINCGILSGHPGGEFSSYISVDSPDGDAIDSWSLDTSGNNWNSWSAPPQLRPAVAGTKEIYASQAGNEGIYNIGITVVDERGGEATETCQINIGNYAPQLTVSCPANVRMGSDYTCENIEAYDPDGDQVSFSFSGLPPGLSGNSASGAISGTASVSGAYDVSVTAIDDYGLTDSETFVLNVNTYCGDGTVQSPNMEGINEDCDGSGGGGTGPDDQYGCTSNCRWAGGYCGDNSVQGGYGEECDPPSAANNCDSTCLWDCYTYGSTNLTFSEGYAVEMEPGDSTNLILPPCVGVDPGSFEVDMELVEANLGTYLGIVFVIDSSGSMTTNDVPDPYNSRMEAVKSAMQTSLDELNDELTNPTEVGLVEYQGSVVSSMSPLELNNPNTQALKQEVQNYQPADSTYTADGIDRGREMLEAKNYEEKIMILLHDGTVTDEPHQQAAQTAKDAGITVYTIAFGTNATVDFEGMEDMATSPDHAYKGNDADLVFSDIVDEVLTIPEGEIDIIINGIINTVEAQDNVSISLEGAVCDRDAQSTIEFSTDFEEGVIRFSNPRIDICAIN